MAQFDFFGSWKDTENILKKILARGDIQIIANMAYREPKAHYLQSISDVELEMVHKNHSVFLASESFSRLPIRFTGPSERGYYSIEQWSSGPIMICGLPDLFEEEGMFRMGAGDIQYPPHFFDPTTDLHYSPPEEMYSIFLSLKKMLQKSMVKLRWKYEQILANGDVRPAIQNFWIAKDAYERMQNEPCFIKFGWRQITFNDFSAVQEND